MMTEELASAPTTVATPYIGPRPFRAEEHEYFFGREREARDLISLVIAERLTLFYAQSGAGKSSLINTRLLPGLRKAGFVPPAGLPGQWHVAHGEQRGAQHLHLQSAAESPGRTTESGPVGEYESDRLSRQPG